MSRPLAVLRPEPGLTATADAIVARGHRAVRVPLFDVSALAWDAPDPSAYDALLLTSANAVRHGGPQLARLRGLPVHAVGSATAAAARDAGFTVVAVGSGGVDDLALHGRVLHLAGREHRARAGVDVVPVYASDVIAADTALLADTVSLVHSPRAGRRLAEVAGRRGDIGVAAISSAAADAVGIGWAAIAIAATTSDSALIDAAIGLAD